jgi:cytochrome b561
VAVLVITSFALGLWIEDMGYYNSWYLKGPILHMSLGLLILLLVSIRWLWRFANVQPAMSHSIKPMEKFVAVWVHLLLYVLLVLAPITGFLLTTSDGKSVSFFGWFDIPAVLVLEDKKDLLGEVHEVLAFSIIALVLLHIAGAVKHHFLDKDDTLMKMLGVHVNMEGDSHEKNH